MQPAEYSRTPCLSEDDDAATDRVLYSSDCLRSARPLLRESVKRYDLLEQLDRL